MTRDEIEPMVPVMPQEDTAETSRASSDVSSDGGRRKRFDAREVTAPLVPDLR